MLRREPTSGRTATNENLKCLLFFLLMLRKVVLYADTWNAEEELRLMEGMDLFRFGNWE